MKAVLLRIFVTIMNSIWRMSAIPRYWLWQWRRRAMCGWHNLTFLLARESMKSKENSEEHIRSLIGKRVTVWMPQGMVIGRIIERYGQVFLECEIHFESDLPEISIHVFGNKFGPFSQGYISAVRQDSNWRER